MLHSFPVFLQNPKPNDPAKMKRKFSSFFKSLVIELDKELYGPDNHLVEVLHQGAASYATLQLGPPYYTNLTLEVLSLVCVWQMLRYHKG